MRAIVLAAGEGKRMRPLTANRPKVMLPVGGRPLLENLLREVKAAGIRDVTLVVHYQRDVVREHFGDGKSLGLKISYLVQDAPGGTGDASRTAVPFGGPVLLLNGDVIASAADLRKIARARGFALGAARVPDISSYGALVLEKGRLVSIAEKDDAAKLHGLELANAGIYRLDESFERPLRDLKPSPRGELEITDAVTAAVRAGARFDVVELSSWADVGRPWDLLGANERALSGLTRKVAGKVEPGARLLGPVVVGKGTRIRSGAYVEGPVVIGKDCDIGPNCYIRPSSAIGDRCRVGNAVEIKNSIVMDGAHVGHLSYVGDSVIGAGANLGAGTVTANLRHDGKTIKAGLRGGERMETGRRKFGAVFGDGVHTGINTTLNVGVMLEAGRLTKPGEVVM
ncbi:MAG: bifunctional sugar-1-phosphate nucleotidylyltransferase/acetyltransferase [Methanobacteriota archaeon]